MKNFLFLIPEKKMAAASPKGSRLTAKYMATGSTPPIIPATGQYGNW